MKLAEQSWIGVRAALARGTPVVGILPCGAMEAHGPHLPLETDVIISEGMARRAAIALSELGIYAFVLPPLFYAPAEYAAAFPGTITIGAMTMKLLLGDIARSLRSQGFACLAIANSHFDPANVGVLREAVQDIRASGFPVAFPDFTRRKLAETLTAEFVSGACHAGQFETSLVLADRPDLVDEAARSVLDPNPASLLNAFAAGAKSFAEAGGPDAYFGNPGEATADEGRKTFQIMRDALVAAIRDAVEFRNSTNG
jgi:creatinine amidohydrolase